MCGEVFLHGLADLSSTPDTRLAQAKFEACYPRLFRGKGAETDEEKEDILNDIAVCRLSYPRCERVLNS